MRMEKTIVFLCIVATACAAPVSTERQRPSRNSSSQTAAESSKAQQIAEVWKARQDTPSVDHDHIGEENHKGFFINQEYSSRNIRNVSGRNISPDHEEYENKASSINIEIVDGASSFDNRENKIVRQESSPRFVRSTEENATRRESYWNNLEEEQSNDSSYGIGEDNIYFRIQTELSENDMEYDVREQTNIREGYTGSIGNQDNLIQNLSDINGHRYTTHGLEDNEENIFTRSKVHWPDINTDGDANSLGQYNEGPSDGWEEPTSLGEYEQESHNNGNNTQACVNNAETSNPNQVGPGDRGSVDDSLDTGVEEDFQGRGDVSPEKSHVKLCLDEKRSPVLVSNDNVKETVVNNTDGKNSNANSDSINDGRNMLNNVTTSQDTFQTRYRSNMSNSSEHKDANQNKSSDTYSFNDEFMQPGESQDSKVSEKISQLDLSSQASDGEESGNTSLGKGEGQKANNRSEQSESKGEDSYSHLESTESQSQSVGDDSENGGSSVSIRAQSHPDSNQNQSGSISETDSEVKSSSEDESESESSTKSKSESSSESESESKSSSESESKSGSSESESELESSSESDSKSSKEGESEFESSTESEFDSISESESESESSSESESDGSSESDSKSSSENKSESEIRSESESESESSSENEHKSSDENETESESSSEIESESKSSSESESDSKSSSESESDSSSEGN